MIRQKILHIKLGHGGLINLIERLRSSVQACFRHLPHFNSAFNKLMEEVTGHRYAGIGTSDGRYSRVLIEHEDLFLSGQPNNQYYAAIDLLPTCLDSKTGMIEQYVIHYADRTVKYSLINCVLDDSLTFHSSKLQEEILKHVQSNILDCIANNKTTSGLFVPLHLYHSVKTEIEQYLDYYNNQYAPSMFGQPRFQSPIGGDKSYPFSHRAKVMYYYPDPVHTRVGLYHVNICITPDNPE